MTARPRHPAALTLTLTLTCALSAALAPCERARAEPSAAAQSAAAQSAAPELGAQAPDFTLTDHTGKAHTLSSYKGKLVVLEWTNPQCPFVVRHYAAKTMTNAAAAHPEVVWLTINSSHFATHEENAKWSAAEGVKATLNDPSGEVGARYGAKTTPHMFVIDAEGKLAYKGAIDDDPHGDKQTPINYVTEALKALKEGGRPAVSETRPYGCSVKYKR